MLFPLFRKKRKRDLKVPVRLSSEEKKKIKRVIDDAKKDAENQKQAILESAKKDITEMVENATRKVVLSGNTSEAYDMFLDNAERSDS